MRLALPQSYHGHITQSATGQSVLALDRLLIREVQRTPQNAGQSVLAQDRLLIREVQHAPQYAGQSVLAQDRLLKREVQRAPQNAGQSVLAHDKLLIREVQRAPQNTGQSVLAEDRLLILEVQRAPQNAGQSVLVGNAEHDDAAAVVAVEIDALCHLPAGDGEENGAPPAVASPPEVVEGERCLHHIHRLYEHQLQCHEGLPGAPAPSAPSARESRAGGTRPISSFST
jgi:hypothetical protein